MSRIRRWQKVLWGAGGLLAVLIAAVLIGFPLLMKRGESRFLSTGPNGRETPQDYGVAYERLKIPSGGRVLDACYVKAPDEGKTPAAIIIFHGAGETISDWAKAQSLLHGLGISTLVFDYSGHGASSKPGSIRNLNEDAAAVYDYGAALLHGGRIYVLGFSMGNAPMLAALPGFRPPPDGVIVGSAFSSLRELGASSETSPSPLLKIAARLIRDDWNNVEAVKNNRVPLLIIHSDADRSNPPFMGEKIFRAAGNPKEFVLLRGLEHNAPLRASGGAWWDAVVRFIRRNGD